MDAPPFQPPAYLYRLNPCCLQVELLTFKSGSAVYFCTATLTSSIRNGHGRLRRQEPRARISTSREPNLPICSVI
jgi:hypothetical protein